MRGPLRDLLASVRDRDPDLRIYIDDVDEPSGDSEIELAGTGKTEPFGKRYLLAIRDVFKVLEVWSERSGGRDATTEDACQAVLYYARYNEFIHVPDPIVEWARDFSRAQMEKVDGDARRLPDGVRQCFLIHDIHFDVACSGVDAWLERHSDVAFQTLRALREVGAHHAADAMDRLFAVFPNGQPPVDREELEDQIFAFGDDIKERFFSEIGDELLQWKDDIDGLMRAYVLKHAKAFHLSEMPGWKN